jgi:ABC-type transport system involved in cytochrome c biogenesis permease subunit
MLRPIACLLLLVALAPATARGQTTLTDVNVDPIRAISVQHNQTLKTLDTFARGVVAQIHGNSTINGQDPVWTLLDMAYRGDEYRAMPLVKIRHAPIRRELIDGHVLPPEVAGDLQASGFLSYDDLTRPAVVRFLENQALSAAHKQQAVQELVAALGWLEALTGDDLLLPPAALVPPPGLPPGHGVDDGHNHKEDTVWRQLSHSSELGLPPGYDAATLSAVIDAARSLRSAWQGGDAIQAQAAVDEVAATLPQVRPELYPSPGKREAELWYNKLGRGTLLGSAIYFVAFTLLLLRGVTGKTAFGTAGTVFLGGALIVHTAAIGVRWWLVDKSIDDAWLSIPIKNQFESVMFSAWFGAIVGLGLELWKRIGFFGAAAGFVGWLSLVSLFASPYVFGIDAGAEITPQAGILMTNWLYIHVTTVTASYAVIAMTFLLGVVWIGGRLFGMNSGTLRLIDSCNLVLLQLAFWTLGVGIVLGALWADVSWGRPWGWDPKETFALVTWLVYLIIVHIRIVTPVNKALWTSILSIIGFGVMLFNWIGVNYFLVGLHSYA